ncbi:type VI secretion system ImpA family N-terminal domain-containing protein [Vibrio sp. C8]
MSNTVLLDQVIYHITSDSDSIRHLDSYQKVRDEINSRFNPLSGGTNWQEVYHSSEQLAQGAGVDLLMSSYLTIAKLKIEGLSGYANGLELLMHCLSLLPKPDSKSAKMRKEVLDWVNSKAIIELNKMKPAQDQLRDLYRSERMCGTIHHWMSIQQPDISVDFEGVGFVLFEHIDKIETRYYTALKRQDKQLNENADRVSRKRHYYTLATTCLVTAALSLTGLWLYYHPNLWNKYPFKQSLEVPVLTTSNLDSYVTNTTPNRIDSVQSEMVSMYQSSIEEKIQASIEQPYLKAIEQHEVLQRLYAGNEQVNQISQILYQDQKLALEQTDQFVAKFGEIRTKMANIALLAKKHRWSQISDETKSLEQFAVSLSPIYGRVGYIESLIDDQHYQQAQQELAELKWRLNNLSWKVAALDSKLSTLQD